MEAICIFAIKTRTGQIKPGYIIVAGKNFGCGSSREQAPEVIKALSIKMCYCQIICKNILQKFINNGLLLIENADLHDEVTEGDTIDVEVNAKITHNGKAYPIASLPDNLGDILMQADLLRQ